jgi:hydroxymethylglutaryl-CoA lyase
LNERVRITDVAPRDGLQNEPAVIATSDKRRLVEALLATGVDEIEISSFVSPKWVPQLADAAELFEQVVDLDRRPTLFSALVPNERGMEAALRVNDQVRPPAIDKIAVFTAASETFSQRNTNATIAETISRFRPVIRLAKDHGFASRGYVSCVVACPFEGPIAPEQVSEVCLRLAELGVDEIDLGETIGLGTPESITAMLKAVIGVISGTGAPALTLHLHDTRGQAAECVLASLECGIRSFDGAAGGLGGCPYASTPGKRAPGNISTLTLVRTIEAAGFETGVDCDALEEASEIAARMSG